MAARGLTSLRHRGDKLGVGRAPSTSTSARRSRSSRRSTGTRRSRGDGALRADPHRDLTGGRSGLQLDEYGEYRCRVSVDDADELAARRPPRSAADRGGRASAARRPGLGVAGATVTTSFCMMSATSTRDCMVAHRPPSSRSRSATIAGQHPPRRRTTVSRRRSRCLHQREGRRAKSVSARTVTAVRSTCVRAHRSWLPSPLGRRRPADGVPSGRSAPGRGATLDLGQRPVSRAARGGGLDAAAGGGRAVARRPLQRSDRRPQRRRDLARQHGPELAGEPLGQRLLRREVDDSPRRRSRRARRRRRCPPRRRVRARSPAGRSRPGRRTSPASP